MSAEREALRRKLVQSDPKSALIDSLFELTRRQARMIEHLSTDESAAPFVRQREYLAWDAGFTACINEFNMQAINPDHPISRPNPHEENN